jgi:leucyl-tRNA synthetase
MKWQERRKSSSLFAAEENSSRRKYYVLEILHPSGTLHAVASQSAPIQRKAR